jgi:F0F1-type ATP synthase assembly protein I
MNTFIELLIELSVRLIRFVLKHFRAVFGLLIGALVGLAFGLSLARYGGVSGLVILMFMVIGAVVVAPIAVDFLNRLSPKR